MGNCLHYFTWLFMDRHSPRCWRVLIVLLLLLCFFVASLCRKFTAGNRAKELFISPLASTYRQRGKPVSAVRFKVLVSMPRILLTSYGIRCSRNQHSGKKPEFHPTLTLPSDLLCTLGQVADPLWDSAGLQ